MEISEKLKACRSRTDMTQEDVAKKLNVSRKTISGWETGRNYPDVGSLVRLSNLYGISLDDLLRDDHILNHFDALTKMGIQENRVLSASYYLNITLLILSYIDLIRPYGFHFQLIPILLLGNLIVFLSHYSQWERFKNAAYIISSLISLVVIFLLNALLSAMTGNLTSVIAQHSVYFSSGAIMARVTFTLLISLSLIVIIFFRKRNNTHDL